MHIGICPAFVNFFQPHNSGIRVAFDNSEHLIAMLHIGHRIYNAIQLSPSVSAICDNERRI